MSRYDRSHILLIDFSFYTEISHGNNSHKCLTFSIISCLTIIDGFDHPCHLTDHFGIFYGILQFLNLNLFTLFFVFALFQFHLCTLNLHRIIQLCILSCTLFFFFKCSNLIVFVTDRITDSFQFQLCLTQIFFIVFCIISKQRSPFFYFLTFFHIDFLDRFLLIRLNLQFFLCLNYTGKTI